MISYYDGGDDEVIIMVIKRLWGRQPEKVFNNTFVTRPWFAWL